MHEEESGITEAAHAAGAAIVARVTAPAAGMKKAPYGAFFIAAAKPLILLPYRDMHSVYPKACPQSLWVTPA